MEIPEILYHLRTAHKYSQENVAVELGVDYTTYARYEAGKTELKATQARKLADLYKLTLDEFYNYGEKINQVNEPSIAYERMGQTKVSVTVDLDGTDETIDKWLRLLPELNRAVKMQMG